MSRETLFACPIYNNYGKAITVRHLYMQHFCLGLRTEKNQEAGI
jgi:hypothetical protein